MVMPCCPEWTGKRDFRSKAWYDLTYDDTVAELRDHWGEFQRYGYEAIPSDTTKKMMQRKEPI